MRLIARYRKTGELAADRSRQRTFPRRYTVEDVAALARFNRAHERLSGPATRAILKREFEVKGFHSDSGSEFINWVVADLLKKLLIWLPERPRPKAEPGTPETTAWSRPRTPPSSANTSASAILLPATPNASTSFTATS